MKILVIFHDGFIAPRLRVEMRSLIRRGHKVTLVRWIRSKVTPPPESGWETIDIPVAVNPTGPWKWLSLPKVYRYFKKALKYIDCEVVHCTHLALLPLALKIGEQKNAKVIYDAWEFFAMDYARHFSFVNPVIQYALESLENRLVRKTAGILTVDSLNNFLIKRYRRHQANVEVLFNVPEIHFEPENGRVEDLRNRYEGYRLLVYTGGITHPQGAYRAVETLEKVLKQIPNAYLLLIGSCTTEEKEILNYAKRIGIQDAIELVPFMPYEEMLHFLKLGEVALSLYQPIKRNLLVGRGNGRKLFTYMQAGIPIVAPNFGEIGRLVEEVGCGVLVDTTDVNAIAEAILFLLNHPEKAKDMGKRGRIAFEKWYNWDREEEKFWRVYNHVVSGD